MVLKAFHAGEILHDVCLGGGRLLVMLCNDGCKEFHPHAVRLVSMAMLQNDGIKFRIGTFRGFQIRRLGSCFPDSKESFMVAAHARQARRPDGGLLAERVLSNGKGLILSPESALSRYGQLLVSQPGITSFRTRASALRTAASRRVSPASSCHSMRSAHRAFTGSSACTMA